jgi:hypothetical protein
MMDPWFLYVLGILMAVAGWLGGRATKETEELERLMNSGLEEWEIVKLRIAMQKVDLYSIESKQPKAIEEERPSLKELFGLLMKRK